MGEWVWGCKYNLEMRIVALFVQGADSAALLLTKVTLTYTHHTLHTTHYTHQRFLASLFQFLVFYSLLLHYVFFGFLTVLHFIYINITFNVQHFKYDIILWTTSIASTWRVGLNLEWVYIGIWRKTNKFKL